MSETAEGTKQGVAEVADPIALKRASYNKLVRQAKLIAISLVSLKFDVARGDRPEKGRKLGYDGALTSFNLFSEPGAIHCDVEWKVVIKVGKKRLAKCSATYLVLYGGIERDTPEDIARLYAENVARAATYTYFRALYANLDWSAYMQSPPLPTIQFTPRV